MTYFDPERFRLQLHMGGGEWRAVYINVPLAIVLGRYEKLTDEELEDHLSDVAAERDRRQHD